jgi:hypothetical protein
VQGQEYGQHEQGNTLTFEHFRKYLEQEFAEHKNLWPQIEARMKDIMIDSFLSVRHKMNPNKRRNVFELFGFDYMIDEDFRIWLIEINTNPFLGTPNADMQQLVPKMINELIAKVVDPKCEPEIDPEVKNDGFELIYKESSDEGQAVNQRRAFDLDLCYPVPDLKPFIGKKEKPLFKAKCLPKIIEQQKQQNDKTRSSVVSPQARNTEGSRLS